MFYTLYHIFKQESIQGRGTIKDRGMIKGRGMTKVGIWHFIKYSKLLYLPLNI